MIGIIAALLTLSLESSSATTSGNIGSVITALVFPGLFGSIVITDNVHDISVGVAATFKFVFYCGLSWVTCALFNAMFKKRLQ